MEITKEQLQKLKMLQIELLKAFISICEKESLRYFVTGGTLLGAVRHKGFIPWDDDIDVAMPRSDYEKFILKAQTHLPNHFFLQTNKTDSFFPCNFAKLRNSETAFVESTLSELKINHGVCIDIFPLDYYPEKNRKIFEVKKLVLTLRISACFKTEKAKLKTNLARKLLSILMPDLKKAVGKREKLFKSVPESRLFVNNSGAWGEKEVFPSEWCSNYVSLTFEGITVNAPEKYDEFLTNVYGNYMKLPPENERIAHHYCDVIDLENSYLKYIN